MVKYDNTILRPIVEELLQDDQVEESQYYIKHPVIDNPKFPSGSLVPLNLSILS